MKHLIQFSTGAASAEVAWRVAAEQGMDDVVLLTADTLVEDEDNWRFAGEVAAMLGCEWVRLTDGRTPMQVGRDHKAIPNNRMAICSRVLKRDLLRKYLDSHYCPADATVYLGFDWSEPNRAEAAKPHWFPWTVRFPLMEPPYLWKADILRLWRERGIEPPRLYAQGFAHANCGGACVRGGQAQWSLLLSVNRSRYLQWESEEQVSRNVLGKNVSILRDRSDGGVKPLTLRAFRERIEQQPSMFDADDWGACGCFAAEADDGVAR
jgi:hypothetical protein